MKVLVIFYPAYTGGVSDSVWIIDSPENRDWFERHVGNIDANSAVFQPSDPLAIIWNVFDHQPGWIEIVVVGEQVRPELERAVSNDAVIVDRTADGFALKRRN